MKNKLLAMMIAQMGIYDCAGNIRDPNAGINRTMPELQEYRSEALSGRLVIEDRTGNDQYADYFIPERGYVIFCNQDISFSHNYYEAGDILEYLNGPDSITYSDYDLDGHIDTVSSQGRIKTNVSANDESFYQWTLSRINKNKVHQFWQERWQSQRR